MEFLREEKPPKNDWREGMSQTTLVVVNIIFNINSINNVFDGSLTDSFIDGDDDASGRVNDDIVVAATLLPMAVATITMSSLTPVIDKR
jgi:hypothetical protein